MLSKFKQKENDKKTFCCKRSETAKNKTTNNLI